MKKMNPRKALAPLSLLLLSLSLLSCGKKAEKKETASQAPTASEKETEPGSTAVQKETATASAAQKETPTVKDTSQENAVYSAYLDFLEKRRRTSALTPGKGTERTKTVRPSVWKPKESLFRMYMETALPSCF